MPASDDSPTVSLPATELERLCTSTILAAGSSEKLARSLAAATVAADRRGKIQVGTAHLFDYLDGLEAGRINGAAVPRSVNRLPAAHLVDGELGYYTMRLARRGLIALAGGNSPALMSLFGSRDTVTGTNPLSFALPHPQGPRMFDQASSATAWVNIRDAADRGESIPEGWSQAPDGTATTDPEAGLAGSLLPFGGVKGSNLALMIELLAAHGGANFSVDAPPIDEGTTTPGTGLFVIAISADAFDPEYTLRVEEHLARLDREFGIDFGRKRDDAVIDLPQNLHTALLERAAR
ncbi:MAG: Ldh family oxidoreductase [Brevibacterium aurantiacum]|nr:Ldh family oxidoreductase [Brevibacterium aurantiacum]